MSLLFTLPPELLLGCYRQLEYICDLNALAQTCKDLYSLLNPEVYKILHRKLSQPPPTCRNTSLHWAAENGKAWCIRAMMRSGISPVLADENGRSPVVLAAEKGHTEVLRVFMDFGVNAKGWVGYSTEDRAMNPLNAAITKGHPSVVKLLIEHGVELEYDIEKLRELEWFNPPSTPLRNHGVLILRNSSPKLPLSVAVKYHQNEIVEELLEHGCDPLLPENYVPPNSLQGPRNAFQTAATCNPVALGIFLRRGIEAEFEEYGLGELHQAALDGHTWLFTFLWEECGARLVVNYNPNLALSDDPSANELSDLSYLFSRNPSNSPEMAALLLEKIDVEEVVQQKCLHPMRFIMEGAASWGYEDLIRRFLAVDWNERHPMEEDEWLQHLSICLARAVKNGFINIVQLMLENGADVNGVDPSQFEDGNPFRAPPVIEAIRQEDAQMVKLLLKNGADPYLTYTNARQWRQTAFEACPLSSPISEAQFQIIQCLVDNNYLDNSNIDARSALLSRSVLGGERLFDLIGTHIEGDLAPGDYAHQKALCSASSCGEIGIMKRLLDTGLDPNVVQLDGKSLILLAAGSDKISMETAEQTVSFLLSQGAKIDSENPETGETNLSFLCSLGRIDFNRYQERAAKILIENGANLFNTYGNEFPMVKAARKSKLEVVKVFLEWFEQENIPFKEIKSMIEKAIESTTHAGIKKTLRRFYWPRVYPAPSS